MTDIALSEPTTFSNADWTSVPERPGTYVIYDREEVIYVGMAGRNGKGTLRRRLRDHSSGQIVNMFAQYLFLAKVQFMTEERIKHPTEAKAAIRQYIAAHCLFSYAVTSNGAEARTLENKLKVELKPTLNP